MQHEIHSIIFDLGGVILNIDYQKTEKAFKQLGFPDFDELYTQFQQTELFVLLEKGQITQGEFLNRLASHAAAPVSQEKMIEAWNAMLLDIPKANIDFLKKSREWYNTFLLSNTNAIHYEAFFAYVESTVGTNDFNRLFNATYYSHQIGARKPDKEAFEHVLHNHNLQPEKTLFIEDSPQHIEAAQALGLHTFHKTPDAKWEDVIQAYALKPFS